MKELLLVGRGGEGVVLASQILADAFARAGFFVQAFPEFKAERRGAPISAFLRWDEKPIHRRYKVRDCDVLVVVSPSPPSPQAVASLRPGGLMILNREARFPGSGPFEIARVPGSRIARENAILSAEGRPMGNVAVLGACIKLLAPDGLGILEQAVASRMGAAAGANVIAAREGYARCTRQHTLAGDAPLATAERATGPRTMDGRLPRQHHGLAPERDRLVGGGPAGALRRVHRVRGLRALLPGGRDHAHRRLDGDRLPLLQGLRHLRRRLPGPRRDRDGGGQGMIQTLPHGRVVLTSDEAAAYAVMLARVRAIGCYPITPQTVIVERLADLAAGRDEIEYEMLESEHSMFGYVIAASRAGVRTFTATSSQGLLYAHEQLHRASRERVPLVAVNVNRAILAPWSLESDHSDSMSQRDTGWIQLYCSSAQEVLDDVLCAYRIAETAMLPVLICAEGFLLSHTAEVLDVPEQDAVDAFVPDFRAPDDWLLDPDRPRTFSALPEARDYAAFQQNVADAMDGATGPDRERVRGVRRRSSDGPRSARSRSPGTRTRSGRCVAIGTIGDTAQELLADDDDLLVVRVHAYRPFPAEQLASVLARASYVSIVDRVAAFGSLGPLGADIRSLRLDAKAAVDFVCGVGGTDVTPDTLRWILDATQSITPQTASRGPVAVPEGV